MFINRIQTTCIHLPSVKVRSHEIMFINRIQTTSIYLTGVNGNGQVTWNHIYNHGYRLLHRFILPVCASQCWAHRTSRSTVGTQTREHQSAVWWIKQQWIIINQIKTSAAWQTLTTHCNYSKRFWTCQRVFLSVSFSREMSSNANDEDETWHNCSLTLFLSSVCHAHTLDNRSASSLIFKNPFSSSLPLSLSFPIASLVTDLPF